MSEYKFQINGTIEFIANVSNSDVAKVLEDRVAIHGTEILGTMVHIVKPDKKLIRKKTL